MQSLSALLRLAVPIVVVQIGIMFMGVIDTIMVGHLSARALAAVALGNLYFWACGIFGMGVIMALDPVIAQAVGAKDDLAVARGFQRGFLLALLLTVPTSIVLLFAGPVLRALGQADDVVPLAVSYAVVCIPGVLPFLAFNVLRQTLQAMELVRPIVITMIVANLANILLNWVLIFGKLGAPALGVAGAAWATVLSRIVMAAYLLAIIVHRERAQRPGLLETPLRIHLGSMQRLAALSLPAALQLTLEVGVFAAASALAGALAPAALAAHQIALHLAGFTFMVPLGIASAGAVRVGHAIGRRDGPGAARAGWTALAFGAVFMTSAAILFVTIPRTLIGAFTSDTDVLGIGVTLLAVAAVFQLFDGLQGVGTGVLRGLGDTRTPMLWNLAAHWVVGLPVAYTLAFTLGFGVIGLWWGLSLGLIICGIALMVVWHRRIHAVLALLSSPLVR